MQLKLTIGMAHYADFDGVYFTIQHIRLMHPELMPQIEFIVIDNQPGTAHSAAVEGLIRNISGHCAGAKYVPMSGPVGTSPPRNRIFEEASGEYVLAIDCHVPLFQSAIPALLAYYETYPDTRDLISGPMMYDTLAHGATHFNDVWRGEMWGVWGVAWMCCDCDGHFTMIEENGMAVPYTLNLPQKKVEQCSCGRKFPTLPIAGHEAVLKGMKFFNAGQDNALPFEIPGQGLGLFSCRRDAWLGFHPMARGFGGEELYIHEKYRRAGHKAICIPDLKWGHRFTRPDGVKFPLTKFFKVRNYVLEFQELGMDLGPIHAHFVATGLLPQKTWDFLIQNPESEQDVAPCKTCGPAPVVNYETPDAAFEALRVIPRDLNEHMLTLKDLASRVNSVTELTGRRESTLAFICGRPKTLVSYTSEADNVVTVAAQQLRSEIKHTINRIEFDKIIPNLAPCDLLFVDTKHTYAHLKAELAAYAPKVARYIVLHDTAIYGGAGDDGSKPGMWGAITEFLRANPEWVVYQHTPAQYGLTVLSRDARDKKPKPSIAAMAGNAAKAFGRVLAGGGVENVPQAEYEARLDVCATCENRNDKQCSICGCFVATKAQLKTEDCPAALWPLQMK